MDKIRSLESAALHYESNGSRIEDTSKQVELIHMLYSMFPKNFKSRIKDVEENDKSSLIKKLPDVC